MLVVNLVLVVLAQTVDIKELNIKNVCSLNSEQLKRLQSRGSKEIDIQGIVVDLKDYEYFIDVKIQSYESTDSCDVFATVLMPTMYLNILSLGDKVNFNGSFLVMIKNDCKTEIDRSFRTCNLKFAYTKK